MKKSVELADEQIELLLTLLDEEVEFTEDERLNAEAWGHETPLVRFTIDELNEVRKSLSV